MNHREIGAWPARLVCVLIGTLASYAARPAEPAWGARSAEDRYAGRAILLKRSAPVRFRSDADFSKFLKRNQVRRLWASREAKSWKMRYMAFFKAPLSDVQVKVRFYDVTKGRRFVAGDTLFVSQGQRSMASQLDLDRQRFSSNHTYMMYVLSARNVVLARARFRLDSEAQRYSDRVVFKDGEKKAKK